MGRLFNLLFFFIFFVSFCAINIQSIDWGLQTSWLIAIIIFLLYPLYKRGKIRFIITQNFRIVSTYFVIIISCTILSVFFQKGGFIHFDDIDSSELLSRCISHSIYLLFEYILYIYIYIYIQNGSVQLKSLKYFIVYPFFFITLWGIYQWITTFDILPYWDIFNNSLSTKFTYLRFKGDHRTASVFPEPSEYAYFLAFMIPFAAKLYYNGKVLSFVRKPKLFIGLLILSIILCRSMSLFIVLPFILIYVLRDYLKFKMSHIVILIFALLVSVVGIVYLESDRLIDIMKGDDGSAITRYDAFVETISLFKGSPLIGAGFGAVRGLDLLSFLIGTTGVIGTVAFAKMIFSLRKYTELNGLFLKGLKCMIIVALISNPIIDLTFFWPILAFISYPLNCGE